ncbi:MAG: ribonuclease HII [Thermoproteota archaeon]|nr:ribonuclease HII [Candidatus Nitrosopelagicus sp.]MEC7372851.1 ribonuclease HII [Thermoproteota archaeon]MEC9063335.1 ribonuclease HII [Thermoproteota archaeon]MEC9416712.1 ribonuclease HII [Thermoproteota archaeon]MED5282828.1 ribonuclease HII [Thermoproteota archaeon]
MQICGVDDAGRGSMIGPLVIAGIRIEKKNISKLRKLGVRDSKKLSSKKRDLLYKEILKIVDSYHVIRIPPRTIDKYVFEHNLNHLEAKKMAEVISNLNPDISYVDSCDVNAARFGREISDLSNKSKVKSYHYADSRFVVVSAASIIAKVSRDRSIMRLNKTSNLGSGYPSDKKSVNYVKKIVSSKKPLPTSVRKSWKPVQKILGLIN